ncbi:MAG: hypothetical protein IPO87_17155 [Flavobacteriales bacterium]|nr:hypothetical protein [Flavobacteriales bacterium]
MHHILHLVFEIAAFALGFAYYQWLRAKDGDAITEPKRVWIIIGAAAGALLGSRVLGHWNNRNCSRGTGPLCSWPSTTARSSGGSWVA